MAKSRLNVKQKGDRTYVTTGRGTAQYPRLDKPDFKFEKDGVYKVEVRASKKEKWVEELIALIDETQASNIESTKKALKKRKIKVCDDLPYKPIYEVDEDGEETEEETDEVFFRFKMKANVRPRNGEPFSQRPALFDAKRNEIKTRIGGGSTIRVSGELYPWYNEANGAGVSLRLSAVQVIELMEAGATAETYGFGEEDGFDGSEGARADDFEEGGNDDPTTPGDDEDWE